MTKPDGKLLVVLMDIRISIKKQAAGKPGCLLSVLLLPSCVTAGAVRVTEDISSGSECSDRLCIHSVQHP